MDYKNNDLSIETMCTLDEYLDRIIAGISECIKLFHSFETNHALDIIIQIIDGMIWIIDVADRTANIHYGQLQKSQLNDHFIQMTEALTNKDYTLLSDIMEYEVLPVIKEWKIITGNLITFSN